MALGELKSGQLIEEDLVVREKSLRDLKNGAGSYLSLQLCDDAGQIIEARAWDSAEKLSAQCDIGDIVTIKAQVNEYKGQQQLKVISLSRRSAADPSRFVPSLPAEKIAAYGEKLQALIASVNNRHLQAILKQVFCDPVTWEAFCKSAAARSLHSAYVGGLLEHTVNVAVLCQTICEIYPQINRDLLTTAAILHDIGKMDALELHGAIIDYTEEGKLLGEPVLGERRVLAAAQAIKDFPARYRNMLSHLLLSHHGQYEFGAPVLPSNLEAIALHLVDNLEAKTNMVVTVMGKEKDPQKAWSEFQRALDRSIYLLRLDD
jgi:3'-5' exoribonuclease